ncbi:MAG: hypothetical protein ACR2OO_12415 [Thermomicrobiales bacterium]
MPNLHRTLAVACALLAAATGAVETLSVSARQPAAATYSAALYGGNCAKPKGDPVATLTDVVRIATTDVRSLPGVSESTLDRSLESLIADRLAIVVTRSGKLSGMIACGETNAVANPDGSTVAGLREMNGSTLTGIAALVPDGARTIVRIYLATGLAEVAGDETGQLDSVDVQDVATITVDDSGITSDKTEFKVGETIQFDVHNGGAARHEVMIESAGADEEPLIDGDLSAQTEDVAADGDASFIFTFSEAGDFQFADHIGSNTLTLPITVT